MTKNTVKLLPILQEMSSWFTITPAQEYEASKIDQDDLLDNKDRKMIYNIFRAWEQGVYDEDPGMVYNAINSLLEKY